MNEIKKCSISGVGFTFEKAAYNRLNEYLQSLKEAYRNNADSEEILADIEARIAELILSAQSDAQNVVCLPLVENIIAQLGSAEEISDDEAESKTTTDYQTRIPRRLYRDLENAKLGGVCAGLARHFDVDAVWVRLSLFLPILLLFVGNLPHMYWSALIGQNLLAIVLLAYVVMWFAVPASKSARQKLEAEGEHISAQKIASRQGATDEERAKSSLATFVGALGRAALIVLKLMLGLMLFPLVVCAMVFLVLIFATLSGLYTDNISLNIGNLDTLAQAVGEHGVGIMILAFMFLLIPTIYLIYLFVMLLLNKRPRWWVLLLAFALWMLNIVGLIVAGINYAEVSTEDEVVRILKYDNKNSVSLQIQEALDEELSDEERAEWERLLNDPNVESID